MPNVAGFCRFSGSGIADFGRLKRSYPGLHDAICTVLEDEALNSETSPAVLSAYLKQRLGYGSRDEKDGDPAPVSAAPLVVTFEHDAGADGE